MANNNNLPEGFEEITNERELGWDDEIQNDGQDFVLLPESDYDFEVVAFERGRHNGSDKLPPCNKAIVHIKLFGEKGTETTVIHNFFLHTRTEGMISAFLVSIGQKKKGEPIKPRWAETVGARGRCKVGIRKYEGKEYNEIKRFYEPAEKPPTQQQTTFQAGQF